MRIALKKEGFPPLFFAIVLTLFCLWIFLLYVIGLRGPFLFDDQSSILSAAVSEFNWRYWLSASFENNTGPLRRPVAISTFILNHFLFGSNPFSFKAVNLGIHMICAILISVFIYLLLCGAKIKKTISCNTALVVGCLWAIHPIQVSTVLYTVQRMTQLNALFTLLGLICYLYGRQRQQQHQSGSLFFWLISFFIFFPLALCSKETGALFPLYIFCMEYFILKFHCPDPTTEILFKRASYCMLAGFVLFAGYYFNRHLSEYLASYNTKGFSLSERLLTETNVLVFYVRLILFPSLAKMGLYHDDFPIASTINASVLFSFSALLSSIIIAFISRTRAPIIGFGIAWFFISHAIESTVFPLELVFEHRNYLASIGILLIPSYYLVVFSTSHYRTARPIAYGTLFLFFVLFSILTFIRSAGWSSSSRFQREAFFYHPQSFSAQIEMANLLFEEKQYNAAIEQINRAIQLRPKNTGVKLHRIVLQCNIPSPLKRDLTTLLQEIKQYPVTTYTIEAIKYLLYLIAKKECPALTSNELTMIIDHALQNPSLIDMPQYRAMLYFLAGQTAILNHHIAKARQEFLLAYQTFPRDLEPLVQKAALEYQVGLYEAARHTREIIRKHDKIYNVSQKKLDELDKLMQSRTTP